MQKSFHQFKEVLKSKVSEMTYQVWIDPIEFGGIDGDNIILRCPNKFFADYIKGQFLHLIKEGSKVFGGVKDIALISHVQEEGQREQLHLPQFSSDDLARLNFHKGFIFDEFVVGESNQYAHALCIAAASGKNSGRPLYLQGGTGLGKSHLSQAVAQSFLKRIPNANICYLSANDFTSMVVNRVRNGEGDAIRKKFQGGCDFLLIEDIHTLSGRERTQTELAYAIDDMVQRGRGLIFTGKGLPRELNRIVEQLNSRLESSIIATINPPDFLTRKMIIQRKARNQGIQMDEEVVNFLADNLRGDIRKIEGAVIGLVSKSSLLRHKIDFPMAKEIIAQLGGEAPDLSVSQIKHLVCRAFNISKVDLKSRSRKKAVAQARQIAMYFSRKFTEDTLENIGLAFDRNHATVLHAIKQVSKMMDESEKFKGQMEHLIQLIERMRWQG